MARVARAARRAAPWAPPLCPVASPRPGYAKSELLFDGVAELWFEDETSWARAACSAELAAVNEAGRALLDASRTVLMPVDLHVIKDGAIPPMR